jgi:hypothetical protein
MSLRLPIIGRCRVTVTISVNKLLVRWRHKTNPFVSKGTMLGRPLGVGEAVIIDRATALQGLINGMACPARETKSREVGCSAAGLELQS